MNDNNNEAIVKIIKKISISSTVSMAVNIVCLILIFLIHLILSNHLGSENYGKYYFILTLITILSIFSKGGVDTLLIRLLSKYSAKNNIGLIKGLVSFSTKRVISNCIIIIILSIISIIVLNKYSHSNNSDYLYALLLLPCISFLHIGQAKLAGFKLLIKSQIPEKLIFPLLFIITLLFLLYSKGLALTVQTVIFCHTFSIVMAIILVQYFLIKYIKSKYVYIKKEADIVNWKSSARSFILISASYLILAHIDVLMIGVLIDKEQSGIYGIASRVSALVAYGLYISNTILLPYISSLYTQKKYLPLQLILQKVAKYNFILSVFIFSIIVIFRNELLLLFGNKFIQGEVALIILCLAQVINVTVGSVGALMTMSGNEYYVSHVMVFAIILNTVLNLLLIPRIGMEGAAIATCITMISWNCLLLVRSYKKLGINPSVITVL